MNESSTQVKSIYSPLNIFKLAFFSVFGTLLFFMPITINKVETIPLDHLLNAINLIAPWFGPIFTLVLACIGGVLPWVEKSYKKDVLSLIMAIFRTLGIPVCFLMFFNVGPAWLTDPGMMPFVWQKVVIAVTMIVPIGSIFLTFIISFGTLEFIGVLVRPIMRPVYHTPGKSAIDAVASFVGSFSLAIYLTNKLYVESKYTKKEAFIIMTGFSTVSATFMIIVAKTAQLMNIWNFYFWSSLVICFAVTAVTVRLWPITKMEDTYMDGVGIPELPVEGNIFKAALDEGLEASWKSGNVFKNIWENLVGGIKMCFVLTPCMASIGLLAFILVKMTPIFNYVGLIFYPFTFLISLIGVPAPLELAKASAVTLGEMFVPNVLVAKLPAAAKYVIAVTSVSEIIFFAGSIPCLLSSEMKVPFWKYLVVWFERVAISILLAGIVAVLYFR